MNFNWNKRSTGEWLELLHRSKRTNWQQSLPHAHVSALKLKKTARFATLEEDGEAIGLVIFHEVRLGPIHTIEVFRGPLWFVQDPPLAWLAAFAELFAKTFPKRPLRRRRWLPEWKDGAEVRSVLKGSGFQSTQETFETMWIDLDQSEEVLRKQLHPKWRGHLNKGLRSQLDLRLDTKGTSAELFLAYFQLHLFDKGYKSKGIAYTRQEIESAVMFQNLMLFWAYQGEEAIAAILVFSHGATASYHAGWTTEKGRLAQAHNVLLWEALCFLKLKGFDAFDLGGMAPFTDTGIDTFKKGMGGEEFKTPGVFR